MIGLIVSILLSGGPGSPAKCTCLTVPPPTVEDHASECKQYDPHKQPIEAVTCAMWRMNKYLEESKKWQQEAWEKCHG